MSDTTSPKPSAASGNGTRVAIATWAPLAVTVVTLGIFAAAYLIAYLSSDKNTLLLMGGAIVAMSQSTVNFWISSSSSSRAKDDRQADLVDRQASALAVSVPSVIPNPNQGDKP